LVLAVFRKQMRWGQRTLQDLGAADSALGFPAADDHQDDSAHQTNPAQHWGKRNGLLLFRGRLKRAEIQHLFALGVRDPAIRQSDDAYNNKNDADNSGRLHRFDVISTLQRTAP